MIALVIACEIKSKCGVSPLITQPNAMNPSYFFTFLAITTGISNTPGTGTILYFIFLRFKIDIAYNSKLLEKLL